MRLQLLTISLILSISVNALAEYRFAENWSKEDTMYQSVVVILKVIDWKQTQYISKNPKDYYEVNPLLGKHPSIETVNTYFIVGTILHTVISLSLPSEYRRYWQLLQIGMSGLCVSNNISVGIRMDI